MGNWKEDLEELMCKIDTFKNANFNLIIQKAAENWIDVIQNNNIDVKVIVAKNNKADTVKILVYNSSLNMELKMSLSMVIDEDDNTYKLLFKHEFIIDDNKDVDNSATEYFSDLEISNEDFIQRIIDNKYNSCVEIAKKNL